MRPLTYVNVFTSCKGALPLSNILEIHLQKGSILCMSLRVSYWSAMRLGDVFTLSLVNVGVVYVDVVSAVLHVLLWVWVEGPSEVDVTNIKIKAVGVAGVSLTSTNLERQSAALLQALISTQIWYYKWQVPVTICLPSCWQFYHTETFVKACGTADNNFRSLWIVILLGHSLVNTLGLLFHGTPFPLGVCKCVWEECN